MSWVLVVLTVVTSGLGNASTVVSMQEWGNRESCEQVATMLNKNGRNLQAVCWPKTRVVSLDRKPR